MAGRPVGLSKPIPRQNVQSPSRLYQEKRKREREREILKTGFILGLKGLSISGLTTYYKYYKWLR